MAKCAICEKTASHGNKLSITRSHISKRSPRTWKPNLRSVKAEIDGEVKRIHVCAKCLKDGKVKMKGLYSEKKGVLYDVVIHY